VDFYSTPRTDLDRQAHAPINPTLRVLCKLAYGLRIPASDLLVMAERLAAARKTRGTTGRAGA